jgi:hypothetical protein
VDAGKIARTLWRQDDRTRIPVNATIALTQEKQGHEAVRPWKETGSHQSNPTGHPLARGKMGRSEVCVPTAGGVPVGFDQSEGRG